MPSIFERAKKIRCLILDIDGVMTDGTLYFGEGGEVMKAFHVLDGQGLKLLRQAHIQVAVISGRDSPSLRARLNALNITRCALGNENKLTPFLQWLKEDQMTPENYAFMGDDWIDLPVMRRVGLAASVPGAMPIVQEHAHWISSKAAGYGAVRELCEMILRAQQRYDDLLAPYLQ